MPRSQYEKFATTRWSLVRGAGAQARESLEALCRVYWPAVYAFVRRQARDTATAQDLTQEFFARLLEKNLPAKANPARGRFRSFLLASVKNFLSHERDRA